VLSQVIGVVAHVMFQ